MKLLLETWKSFLNEQEDKGEFLLYHATCFPPESFTKGIDATRAKGYGQGAGFYFFTNKQRALNHAKTIISSDGGPSKQQQCPEGSTTAYLIVSDEPVTPENFDIDYEIFADGFAQFIKQNVDYFSENDQALGLGRQAGKGVTKTQDGRILISVNKPLLQIIGGVTTINLNREAGDFTVSDGEIFSKIAEKLNELNPKMFQEFEKQFLSKATAIKYNGKEKIIPLRIEDIEGKIIWNR